MISLIYRVYVWLAVRWAVGFQPRPVFVYHDGRCWRWIDPMDATRRLFEAKDFDWDETPKLLLSGASTLQLDALKTISSVVRDVFGVPAVERRGLTEIECNDLLNAFRDYLGDVKKNGSLFPILSDSTESESSGATSLPRPASDSGSIASEPSSAPHGSPAEPIPGGTAGVSPSA